MKRILIRVVGLLLVASLGAALLLPPLREKRREERVRALLLEVQEALQRYHVREELYPKVPLHGAELIDLLVAKGHLDAPPLNPWTGEPYRPGGNEDWLRYRTDSLAETYELLVLSPGTETVKYRLDSTENQSLE